MSTAETMMSLSYEKRRFVELLSHYPFAVEFWDFSNGRGALDTKSLEECFGSLSGGEKQVLAFLANLWLCRNHFEFDFVEAWNTLTPNHWEPIANWFARPFTC